MAYEFKKLSDVEVVETPTDSANVLIEEDGVIKKAPKTAVGGSGEWDAVIDFIDNVYTSGSYATIKAKLDAGDLPKVLLTQATNYGDDYYGYYQAHSAILSSGGNIYINAFCSQYNNRTNTLYYFTLTSDNDISWTSSSV